MSLAWDDDDDNEDQTEFDLRRRHSHPHAPTKPIKVPNDITGSVKISIPKATPSIQGKIPAELRERFAALLIDSIVIFILHCTIVAILNFLSLYRQSYGTILSASLSITSGFLYFFMSEAITQKTLGKKLLGLSVVSLSSDPLNSSQILLRNLFKIVDLTLFPLAILNMESSKSNQRLGDKLAKTTIVKNPSFYQAMVHLQHTPLSSTTIRILAMKFDFLWIAAFSYGYYLLLVPTRPLLSYYALLGLPVILFTILSLMEFYALTTPGKWLLGRIIVMDNGAKINASTVIIRNLFKPLDLFLGMLTIPLSKSKQSIADFVAHTLVVKHAPDNSGLWTIVLALLLSGSTLTLGLINPHSYGLNPFKNKTVVKAPQAIPKNPFANQTSQNNFNQAKHGSLKFSDFYFASGPGPDAIHHDGKFKAGDDVYVFFKVNGFAIKADAMISLSEKVKVVDPHGTTILDKPDMLSISKPSNMGITSLTFPGKIPLPKTAAAGKYIAQFVITDNNTGYQITFNQNFEVIP